MGVELTGKGTKQRGVLVCDVPGCGARSRAYTPTSPAAPALTCCEQAEKSVSIPVIDDMDGATHWLAPERRTMAISESCKLVEWIGVPFEVTYSAYNYRSEVQVAEAVDVEILRRRPAASLIEFVCAGLQRGVNPAVFMPGFDLPGFMARHGIDWQGRKL